MPEFDELIADDEVIEIAPEQACNLENPEHCESCQ
jgi:hypothetical protein